MFTHPKIFGSPWTEPRTQCTSLLDEHPLEEDEGPLEEYEILLEEDESRVEEDECPLEED